MGEDFSPRSSLFMPHSISLTKGIITVIGLQHLRLVFGVQQKSFNLRFLRLSRRLVVSCVGIPSVLPALQVIQLNPAVGRIC